MKRKLLFLIGIFHLIVIPLVLTGQDRVITGKVYNSTTKEPIPKIKIQLKGVDISTITNSEGEYKLTVPDSIKIIEFMEFSFLRIEEKEIVNENRINLYMKDISINELLSLSLEELMNIKVTTAGKKEEKIGEIPASVVVITRQDIEKYGYQSLQEIYENIPGLYVIDDYFVENVGIRGSWTVDGLKNMTVLINDIPQNEYLTSGNFGELYVLPVESIDRIEIVRGPMSVLYGSGATFGVINIFTNKVENDGNSGLVTASCGYENTKKVTLRSSQKSNEFQYTFNGSFFDTNGLNKSYSEIGSYTGTTKGKMENQEKYLNFSGSFNHFTLDASYSQDNKEVSLVFPSIQDGTMVVFKAMRFRFGYRNNLTDNIKLEAKLNYLVNHWSFDNDILYPNFYGKQTNGNSGVQGEMNLFYNTGRKLSLTVGLNYAYIPEVYLDATIPAYGVNLFHYRLSKNEAIVTRSLFAQADYKISPKLKIVAGARLDQMPAYTQENNIGDIKTSTYTSQKNTFDYTKIEFIPRLAFIYQANESNYFKFLYGKAINRPSFFQTFSPFSTSGAVIKPLVPEQNQTLEFNYTGYLASSFSLEANLFINMLDKLIYRTYFIDNGVLVSYHANIGKMNTKGIELTARYSPEEKFQMELSGTYQKTDDKTNNLEPGYSPHFLGYLKASYLFSKNVSFAITGNYVDKMEPYWDSTLTNTDGSTGRRIGNNVEGYFLLGANFRVTNLFDKGIFINLRGSNLLNTEVRYPATSNNSTFATKGTIGRGISYLFTVGWKF